MALDTARSASSWPTTRASRKLSILMSFSRSPSSIFVTGIPVHLETTSATSSSVTRWRTRVWLSCSFDCACSSSRVSSGMRPYWSSDIRARSPARCAFSSSVLACSSSSFRCVAPCITAFSALQTSSRSEYSRSRSAMDDSSVSSRRLDASSDSLFSASRSIFNWMRRRSSRSSSSGLESISMRMREPASSTRSMALSGSWRSEM